MALATARLDTELVRRGLARSRRRAGELIAEGHVRVSGAPARKASQQVPLDDPLEIVGSRDHYVSRGAHKLIGALEAIEVLAPGRLQVSGRRCLDVGASTGGFTQVLLERGAAHVIAVDVGHGQMAPTVAGDPRVTVREGINARDLTPAEIGTPVDLVVADLSFISLTLVVPTLLDLIGPGGTAVLMVKPQFEVGRELLGHSGVVSSAELRAQAVLDVAASAGNAGATVHAVVPSPLPGPAGNREYFLWMGRPVVAGGGAPSGSARVPPPGASLDPGSSEAGGSSADDQPGESLHDAVVRAVRDDQPTSVRDPRTRVRT